MDSLIDSSIFQTEGNLAGCDVKLAQEEMPRSCCNFTRRPCGPLDRFVLSFGLWETWLAVAKKYVQEEMTGSG